MARGKGPEWSYFTLVQPEGTGGVPGCEQNGGALHMCTAELALQQQGNRLGVDVQQLVLAEAHPGPGENWRRG
eukprot:1151876-Pelagomonas_calceolata.AAC.6